MLIWNDMSLPALMTISSHPRPKLFPQHTLHLMDHFRDIDLERGGRRYPNPNSALLMASGWDYVGILSLALSTWFRSNRPLVHGACTWTQIGDQRRGVAFQHSMPSGHQVNLSDSSTNLNLMNKKWINKNNSFITSVWPNAFELEMLSTKMCFWS